MVLVSLNCFGAPLVSPPRGKRFSQIAAAIAAVDPDLVLLQEVFTPGQKRLAARLFAAYPHRYLPRDGVLRTAGGLVAFSRRPVLQASFEKLRRCGSWHGLALSDRIAGKGIMRLQLGGLEPCTVLHAHLETEYDRGIPRYRDSQLGQLAAAARRGPDPVIIAGDLNMWPDSAQYPRFLRDTGAVDLTVTDEPSREPNDLRCRWLIKVLIRQEKCDYVMLRGQASAVRWHYLLPADTVLTDHRGMVMQIELAQAAVPAATRPAVRQRQAVAA